MSASPTGPALPADPAAPGVRVRTDARWGVAAAVLVLAAGTVASWSSVLGSGLVAAAPAVLAAALLVAGRLPVRWVPALLLAWVPAALVLAGVPGERLKPRNWDLIPGLLADGWAQLGVPERGLVVGDPWPLAAGLVAVGALWLAGAAVSAWRRPSPPRDMLAFAALTLPMVVAIALQQSDDGAWQGGIVVAAATMWLTAGRVTPAIVLGAAVALVATSAIAAWGPHERWLVPGSMFHSTPTFRTLDTDQTYGPLSTRRTGATMLEIRSPKPALWRMRVLERFDGRGWSTGEDGIDLPEPAAVARTTTVRVGKLHEDLLVAPGRITAVTAAQRDLPSSGEARRLAKAPERGDVYRVRSEVVEATAAELRRAEPPSQAVLDRYTFAQVRWPWKRYGDDDRPQYSGNGDGYGSSDGRPGGGTGQPPRGAPYGGAGGYAARWGPWGEVAMLAHDLAAGAPSQFDIVARVQKYLQSSRFRYTTDVPAAGGQPLIDFLLTTHEGYCQHFAGAAALLLRLAGVPTRVVVGFATGEKTGDGQYRVRDEDAHAWIEVYFPGYGWVAFNPTPAAAAAMVPARLDLTGQAVPPATAPSGGSDGSWLAIGGAVVAVGGGLLLLRRRRRRTGGRDLPGALERVAPRVGVPLRPDHTFAQLRQELLTRVGPHVAALTDEATRSRYGPATDAPPADRHATARVWTAVLRDLGPWRTLTTLLAPPGRVSRRG